MSSLRRSAAISLAGLLINATHALAAEKVGEAVLIKTAVLGGNRPLVVKAPVHRDERIRTSNTGLGQFVFRDGTKLAVGWGSSVVIDKYVFDDSNSVKKLSIRAAKGTFRWISGKSKSSAYEILTPAGTIGVRGTAFDFHVMANGITAVVLLNGSARVCGGNGCRELKRPCDCVISTPGRGVTDPRKVNRSIFTTLGTARALPFLSGTQSLTRGFGGTAINCGLSMASVGEKKGTDQRQPAPRSAPASPPSPPAPPAPPAPSAPPAPPAPPAPTASPSPHAPPAPPDPPDPPTPPKPDKPHKPHGHYGKPHGGYGKPHGGYGKPHGGFGFGKGFNGLGGHYSGNQSAPR